MSTSATADADALSSTTLSQIMQQRLSVEELSDIFSDYNNLLDEEEDDDNDNDIVVAAIDYTSDFRIAYKYMKIVLAKKDTEFSIRTFQLSSLCLQYNPANYTIWYYRRQCMKNIILMENDNDDNENEDNNGRQERLLLSPMIDADMQFATNLGGENPKNYQLWYHRRALLEMLLLQTTTQTARDQDENGMLLTNKCQQEMNYIDNVLVNDGKNYHAWSYRQWIILQLLQQASASSSELLLDGELHMTDRLLNLDVRNNSVLNHRWFIIEQLRRHVNDDDDVDDNDEMEYALSMMKLDLYNESPIRYYMAYIKRKILALQSSQDDDNARQQQDELLLLSRALEQLNSLLLVQDQDDDLSDDNDDNQLHTSPCVLSAIVDILEWKGDYQQAIMYTDKLAYQYDCIRERYWIYRKQQLQDRLD